MTAEASATEETARPGGAKVAPPRWANWPVSVLRTARPRQWPKNLLVFAAPLAGATWGRPHGAAYALVAAAAFGCASVAVYFINDVVDAERDRRHPRKRYRPVAAGDLPKSHAVVIGVISSAILAFPYVRAIVLMFFSEPAVEGPVIVRPSAYTGVAVAIGAAATIVLGVIPQPLLNLANHAASQLFVR